MSDAKTGLLGLDLGRQQMMFGPCTLASLISTELSRLQLDGPVTMSEMARRQAIKEHLEGDEVSRTTESAQVVQVSPPSLKAIADARRIRR